MAKTLEFCFHLPKGKSGHMRRYHEVTGAPFYPAAACCFPISLGLERYERAQNKTGYSYFNLYLHLTPCHNKDQIPLN